MAKEPGSRISSKMERRFLVLAVVANVFVTAVAAWDVIVWLPVQDRSSTGLYQFRLPDVVAPAVTGVAG